MTIVLALLPWPAVHIGLFVLRNVWAAFILYHTVCIGGWWFAKRTLSPDFGIPWRRRHWVALGTLCLAADVAVYLVAGLFAALLAPDHIIAGLARMHVGATFAARVALFGYFAAVNPIAEELFWRGAIFSRLRLARWPVAWCAAISGVLFGAWHWLPVGLLLTRDVAIASVAGIMLVGVLLGLFYDRVRNIAAPILLHALGADVPVLVVLWVDVLAKR